MARILLVDDEPSIVMILSRLLDDEGHDVTTATGGAEAVVQLKQDEFDLLLSDIRMPDMDGLELLEAARGIHPTLPIVMLTAYATIETATKAMKLGAYDYITKPFKIDELMLTVDRALDSGKAASDEIELTEKHQTTMRYDDIIARSESMMQVCHMVERIAPTESSVLLTGETGTGKSLVAKTIHAHSKRKDAAFTSLDCSELPEDLLAATLFGNVATSTLPENKAGVIESAEGGTVFLDAIEVLPGPLQDQLLHVITQKLIRKVGSMHDTQVDVRILAGATPVLDKLVEAGSFSRMLHTRLGAISIRISPLRERRDDILPLVYHILSNKCGETRDVPSIAKEAQALFEAYTWPRNGDELEEVLLHALDTAKESITTADLPPELVRAVEASGGGARAATTNVDPHRASQLKEFLEKKKREITLKRA